MYYGEKNRAAESKTSSINQLYPWGLTSLKLSVPLCYASVLADGDRSVRDWVTCTVWMLVPSRVFINSIASIFLS